MDERMALCREEWEVSNMLKDLLGTGFDMLFSELHKIMMIKVISFSFRGDRPKFIPLDPPLDRRAARFFSKGGAEVMEAKALTRKNCL